MLEKIFNKKIFDSHIKDEGVTKREKILGYFVGPCLAYMAYNGVAGTYLTQFYTDVLGVGGIIISWMPLLSKIISSVAGIVIGQVIENTKTSQGKARPWILLSGSLLTVCGILLYAVPNANYNVQIAWVVISYNLFFSLAFSTYSLSHAMMVPLSTRNNKQRDSLAMITSMAISMIPGALVTIILPILVKNIGVGQAARGNWLMLMSLFSILAIPAVLIEYYNTIERVTLSKQEEETDKKEKLSLKTQIKACFKDKYWVMIILFFFISHLCNGLSHVSTIYYANWVLGKSVSEGTTHQLLINAIGQFPLGPGIFLLMPLVKKHGKRNIIIWGYSFAALGSLLVLIFRENLVATLVCLFIKSIGALPMYTTSSLIADALDHVEKTKGIRTDGFSASVNSIAQTLSTGLAQSILLFGISVFGYITPTSVTEVINQPQAIQTLFGLCFAGLPMIGYAASAIIMYFCDLEKAK